MKNLLLILFFGVVAIGCSTESALDVEIETHNAESCSCMEVYYDASIECFEIELEGLKLREKDLKNGNFKTSKKFYKKHVRPAYKKRDQILEKCLDILDLKDWSSNEKCWELLDEFQQNEMVIFDRLVNERSRLERLRQEYLSKKKK